MSQSFMTKLGVIGVFAFFTLFWGGHYKRHCLYIEILFQENGIHFSKKEKGFK